MSDNSSQKTTFVDSTKIGECAAPQPLSGIDSVGASMTVHGTSHGAYLQVRKPETAKSSAA